MLVKIVPLLLSLALGGGAAVAANQSMNEPAAAAANTNSGVQASLGANAGVNAGSDLYLSSGASGAGMGTDSPMNPALPTASGSAQSQASGSVQAGGGTGLMASLDSFLQGVFHLGL